MSIFTVILGDDENIRGETVLPESQKSLPSVFSKHTVSRSCVDCMHDEVVRIFVGVERRIKTGKLKTIDIEPPHVRSRRPLRVSRYTHTAYTKQRHPTSRALLRGVLNYPVPHFHQSDFDRSRLTYKMRNSIRTEFHLKCTLLLIVFVTFLA